MAQKAGRVGLAWQDVDQNGHLIDGGGGDYVEDVKVDGQSVVTDGVANITLPTIDAGDVMYEETTNYSEADVAIVTITAEDSLALSVYTGTATSTEVTIDGATHNILEYASSTMKGFGIPNGRKLMLRHSVYSSNQFIAEIGAGMEFGVTVNSEGLVVAFVHGVGWDTNTQLRIYNQTVISSPGNSMTIKFYKIKEV